MQILHGAVAYRHDLIPKYRREIPMWGFFKQAPQPVAGQKCPVKCDLMVEAGASQDALDWYVGTIRARLQEEDCSKHTEVFRLNPPA